MRENMIIVTGDYYTNNNISKVTKNYSSDQYSIMELIYRLFNYGKSTDFDLGYDLYDIIAEYIEEKLNEYPNLKKLELYKNDKSIYKCVDKLFNTVTNIIPYNDSTAENIHSLHEIHYISNGQANQFKTTLTEEETLLALAENYESIFSLK